MKPRVYPSIYYSLFVAFGGFIFGIDTALISGTLEFIVADFNLNEFQLGNVVSAPALGVIFALGFMGWFCDQFGRKKALILIASCYLISAVFSALAQSYTQLFIARMLGGMAFTSLSIAAMYIGEIAPADRRGKLVSLNQILIVAGVAVAQLFNYLVVSIDSSNWNLPESLVVQSNEWRWMLGFEIIPAIIWLLLVSLVPESPRWLIGKNRLAKAKLALAKLVKKDQVEAELIKLVPLIHAETPKENLLTKIRVIVAPKYRLIILIGIAFACVQPLTGMNPILYFAPMIFDKAGVSTSTAYSHTLLIGIVGFFTTLWTVLYIEKFGRRFLVNLGLVMSILGLALCSWAFNEATYIVEADAINQLKMKYDELKNINFSALSGVVFSNESQFLGALNEIDHGISSKQISKDFLNLATRVDVWLVLTGILIVVGAFHISIGPVMWVVFSEIVPTTHRAILIPLFALITSIVSYLMQKFFPWMLLNMGADGLFASYAVASLIGFMFLYKLLPETTGKTIEEIEQQLVDKKD